MSFPTARHDAHNSPRRPFHPARVQRKIDVVSIRVVLGDDDADEREQLRHVLEGDGFTVVGETGSGAAAVPVVAACLPDLLLLDVPAGTMDTLWPYAAGHPTVALVVRSASRAEADVLAALRCGARGYLDKSGGLDRLGATLRGVLAGEAALPRDLMSLVLADLHRREPGRHRVGGPNVRLTDRESEVLDLLVRGIPTARIADELFVSTGTVRTHIAALLHKLGVDSRDDAVALLKRT